VPVNLDELDREIEQAKTHLYALYRKRRMLRDAMRPAKPKRLQWGEVLIRARNGQKLAEIAAEFGLKLATIKSRLRWDKLLHDDQKVQVRSPLLGRHAGRALRQL